MKRTVRTLLVALSIAALAPGAKAALAIKVLQDPSELPAPLARHALKGDYVMRDGKFLALIGGPSRTLVSPLNIALAQAQGCILGFVPEGRATRALVQIGGPSLRVEGKSQPLAYTSIRPDGAGLIATAVWNGPGKSRLEIRTRYDFSAADGRATLTSDVRNTGTTEIPGVSYGLGANILQSYNFSPYQARVFPGLNFRVYERPDHALGWSNPNPVETTEKPLPGLLRPGQSFRVSYTLVTAADVASALDKLYALARVKTERARVEFKGYSGPAEVVLREAASGAIFYRTFLDKAAVLEFPVLKGTYTLRTHQFPSTREQTVVADSESSRKWVVQSPVLGTVHLNIRNPGGGHVPGKVSFIGLDPTPSPYFKPENPIVTGRSWESFKNSVYPPKDGMDAALPSGTYLVSSSRGPEYTRETKLIEVLEGSRHELDFTLDKVVDTRGLIALDSHLHTQNSDGNMLVPNRLRSAVVEGLDVVVATDHNFLTDYSAEVDRLGISDLLAVIQGVEVTARTGSIHFNTFPAARKPDLPNNGAISVDDDAPAKLFALAQAKDPGTLLHLNHPRSRGLGYFLTYAFDPEKAASAKAPFDLGFDVLEAMNGARLVEGNRQTIEDWFHLLNRGYAVRAVGTSDSHSIDGGEPGYCRTYVLYGGPKGKALDAAAVVKAVREGRSFLTNGPLISARAGKATFGDLARAKKGRLDLAVKITGAPWLDVSEVRIVVNGERKIILPVASPARGTVKFEKVVRIDLPVDSWIAVEAVGTRSIYPVIQQRSGDGKPANAALPFALTNPILVDVDGDGRSAPVWPEKVQIK
jgi:hypothetical protein